jgi:tRNA nucleotidyltransferase/poly(A) polymerase
MEIKLPEKVVKIMKIFTANGAEIYAVGGAIRDMMLGREVNDWDFATNLTPDEMKTLFPKNSFYENNFGTFSIVLPNKEIFEVTTYRTEQEYTDSRHPGKVLWGKTIEEDLMRRNFTINAMALDIDGKLIDLYGGKNDLENRLIKAVGNADERFKEDALRMLIAIKLAAMLKFTIEEVTFKAIFDNAKLINNVAGERIRVELFKILLAQKPADGFILLKNSGLLAEIMPELLEGVDVAQKGHHIYDVWKHSLESLNNCDSMDPITRLASLIHDVGKPASLRIVDGVRTFHNHEIIGSRVAVKIGKRLRFSNKELDQLFRLVRWHMFTASESQTDSAVKRFIRNVTPEYIDEMIAIRRADRMGSGSKETSWRWELFKNRIVEVQKQPFSINDLKVDGYDVMEVLKIKPGRKIGEILKAIFAEVEEDPTLNDRDKLLEKIKSYDEN